MRRPQVQKLHYELVPCNELIQFREPPAVTWTTPECRIAVEGTETTVEMLQHVPTVDEARVVVEQYLRAWEIDAALDAGHPLFRFKFKHGTTIDLAPSDAEDVDHRELHVTSTGVLSAKQTAVVSKIYSAYPPHPSYALTLDVEAMWLRWKAYRAGGESLAGMAYWCLTVLEVRAGGRDGVKRDYGISRAVLNKLGYLSSEVGDETTGRKADVNEPRRHTSAEIRWIEAVVKAMIRRAGEHALDSHKPFVELTMADLPPL